MLVWNINHQEKRTQDGQVKSGKVKVKCNLVQALRLCTGCTAHRGCRGIALLFLDHGTKRGWGISVTPKPLFAPGKDPVPVVQEAGWAPGPVWTGAENLVPVGIRSPDRPVRNQSLYRLSYPAHPPKEASGLFTYWNRNGTRRLSPWKRDDDGDDDPTMWWWLYWWLFIQRSFR